MLSDYINESEDVIIEELRCADDAYYNSPSGATHFSDEEYDELRELAQTKFPNNPYFKTVGSEVKTKAKKVPLPFIIGSLKKYKQDTIGKFVSKFNKDQEYLYMPKLDGASLFSHYNNGKLVQVCTRGNGYEGFDITHKAKYFLPNEISDKGEIFLRHEALLVGESYKDLGFSNRRNGVSGILNRETFEGCEHVKCITHEYLNSTKTYAEDFEYLKTLGFDVIDYSTIVFGVYNDPKEILTDILKNLRNFHVYDLDGLVICPSNYKRENSERPENKVAFKVNSEGIGAEIDYIEWNTSRTGRVVPLAIFKNPIPIDGTNVSKATCHNYGYIIINQVGPGAFVKVLKSGDIIPQIVEVITTSEKMNLPVFCSSCGTDLKCKGVDVVCDNKHCPEQSIGFLEHFFKTLGVENVSGQTFRNLEVYTLRDAFSLSVKDIEVLEGFGEKKGKTIVSEIHKAITNVKPDLFLAACGIATFGKRNSKKFMDTLDPNLSSQEKFEKIFEIEINSFTSIEGFGSLIFNNVFSNLLEIKEIYETCKTFSLTFEEKPIKNTSEVETIKVTVTGKGPYPRKTLEEMFKNRGFEIIDFSSQTKILICEDVNSSSSKMTKAKKSGISITTYEEFLNEYM